MTNQQAINILNGLEQSLDDYCELNDEGKAAFRMAITALESFGNSEQLPSAQPDVSDTNVGNTIYRQAAIEAMCGACSDWCDEGVCKKVSAIQKLPSAQPERDTPRKPTETTSRMWGIREKEPVCPKCGYYLGHWRFLGKRITYCEHCGQAIDWEGWDFDE